MILRKKTTAAQPNARPSLPPLLVGTAKPWTSSGVAAKPSGCGYCRFNAIGTGFAGDYLGREVKMAVMLPHASKDEVMARESGAGGYGYWLVKNFVEPLGYTRDNVLLTHVIRCS